MIEYPVGTSGEVLTFSDKVLKHFTRYRQNTFWKREAGGQLFARINRPVIEIVEATGPRRTDRRTRTSYHPDRQAEQLEIEMFAQSGHTYVGDWHTHPEEIPTPSNSDIASINDTVRKSTLNLNGLVLAIVGTGYGPNNLFVSVCDRLAVFQLEPREMKKKTSQITWI